METEPLAASCSPMNQLKRNTAEEQAVNLLDAETSAEPPPKTLLEKP